jgi:hypothetical protein
VLMLTAMTPEDLVAASRLLLTGPVQAQTRGDLVLIEPGEKEPKVTSMASGERYATGKKGSYSALESFLYTRPVAYYGTVAFAVLAFVAALYYVLRRRRARKK